MGYLDNRTITVEAVLTKKGRQLLSQGKEFFNITQFALSDDEVDYKLWNSLHPSGSSFYGVAIERMPILEPSPDETQALRYKLVSLNKNTVKIPVVTAYPTSIIFSEGEEVIITPNTVQGGGSSGAAQTVNLNSRLGYTAILKNSDVAILQSLDPDIDGELTPVSSMFLGDSETSKSVFVKGKTFKLIGKGISSGTGTDIRTTLTIIGNETGGSVTITVTNRNRVTVDSL